MLSSVLVTFHDLSSEEEDFLGDVVLGLSASPKSLPCKYFYDEYGSKLFEKICELPEYYPTRVELSLMHSNSGEISASLGQNILVLEYGCGSIGKVRILLDALENPASYVAVDISREHLKLSANQLARDYPNIVVHAICADFSKSFKLPHGLPGDRKVAFFPGSTIGNLEPFQVQKFLSRIAADVGEGGGLLIGVDRKKDEAILHAAYNDQMGITAAFNLNLLTRINSELGGDFDLNAFKHEAVYNSFDSRIEMYLVSLKRQTVKLGQQRFSFFQGERVHTENSHKYNVKEFKSIASQAGFKPKAVWSDANQYFSIFYLEVI